MGDLRGTGFFYALELVKDKETRASFSEEECDELLRGFVSPRAVRGGADLPRGRPRRPGRADLPAARGGPGGVRGDRGDARRSARGGRRAHAGRGVSHDVIVVGGGHNGLTCAAYLAHAGLDVCVLERRDVLGGACVTEELWPGQRVSRASYVVSMLQPKIVSDLRLHDFGYEADAARPELRDVRARRPADLLLRRHRAHAESIAPLLEAGRRRLPALRGRCSSATAELPAAAAAAPAARARLEAARRPARRCCARPAAPPGSRAATCTSCSA